MSVECGLYIVDWEGFRRAVAKVDEPGAVLAAIGAEPEPLSQPTLRAQNDFLEALDAAAGELTESGREPLLLVFEHLFWSWRNEGRRILECGRDDTALDSAWSPDTVKRLAAAWESVDLDALRQAAERTDAFSARFETWAELAGYADEWGGAIERAAETGSGIAVFVF